MIETYIDYDQLKNRIGDDNKLVSELLEILKIELKNYKQSIEFAFENNDKQELETIIHKLKSAIGIFGFRNIYDKLISIEEELKKNIQINCFYNELMLIFISVKNHIIELEKNVN
ncbi:MAG: Hpt domain-containing protein [Bacteroidales bacterium]|jgi:HPt (histidine-containing phosphotransfer) domain-containing protein|nr:Hpt domain-containing protein [Bacteroidales bacterium]MCK9499389.1 Hpt domain-containing protein [Bacteroidales bacterium]MDY0315134.1 Hpt domain-containing protein [Bacteroidales bacterium]